MHLLRSTILRICLLTLFLLAYTSLTFSSVDEVKKQWRVHTNKESDWPLYWLVNTEHPELKQEMFLAGPIAGGRPWIDKIIEVDQNKGIYLITYYAGQPGTSELVDTYYALIYNDTKKSLLGQYPYRYISDRYDYSPKWMFEENRILITEEGGDPVTINY